MTARFRPTRAGIFNLWHYADQVFLFADGRLVLRGANGSGKTKALELLFPLVLDGSLDPRRLDPFSSDGRRMRDNVLAAAEAGGNQTATGYAWMTFSRPVPGGEEHVTTGIGVSGSRERERVDSWYFVTPRVPGVDMALHDADRRPLSRRGLREALGPEAVHETVDAHRRAVDAALFGLGDERFGTMLDLVLQLRKPKLAALLDPEQISELLSRSLRPVDDAALDDVAKGLAELERIHDELAAMRRASDALDALHVEHRQYLRTHARLRLDALQAAQEELARLDADLRRDEAAAGLAQARATDAQAAADAAAHAEREAQGEAAGLRASDAYRAGQGLADRRSLVATLREQAAREAVAAREAAGRSQRAARAATQAADALRRLQEQLDDGAHRLQRAAEEATGRLTVDLLGPPTEVEVVTRAAIAARRHALDEVDAAARRAGHAQAGAEEAGRALDDAHRREAEARKQADAAAATVHQRRDELAAGLGAWHAAHPCLTPEDLPPLRARALDGDRDEVAGLAADLDARLAPRREALAADLRSAEGAVEAARREEADLQALRARVAAARDDAPPPSPWRPAAREGRPGAPLWRLVDFAPHLSEAERAALEGALLAAGLLDAWVGPAGAALADDDGALVLAEEVAGPRGTVELGARDGGPDPAALADDGGAPVDALAGPRGREDVQPGAPPSSHEGSVPPAVAALGEDDGAPVEAVAGPRGREDVQPGAPPSSHEGSVRPAVAALGEDDGAPVEAVAGPRGPGGAEPGGPTAGQPGEVAQRTPKVSKPTPTLADLLQPEEQPHLPRSHVAALLRTLPLGRLDELPIVIDGGRFRLGPLRGGLRVERARYIGATARAAERARRLAELDAQLAQAADRRAAAEAALAALRDLRAALELAARGLPPVQPLLRALDELQRTLERRQHALDARHEAEARAAARQREAADLRDALRRVAAERGLPDDPSALQGARARLTAFSDDLNAHLGRLRGLPGARAAADEREAESAESAESAERAAAQAADSDARHAAESSALQAIEDAQGADIRRVLADLDAAEQRARASAEQAQVQRRHAEQARGEAIRHSTTAEGHRAHRPLLVRQVDDAARRAHVLLRPAFALLLHLDPTLPDDTARLSALRAAAGDAATSEPRQKHVQTSVQNRFDELTRALGARLRCRQTTDDGLLLIEVDDDGPGEPSAVYAQRLLLRLREQEGLLEKRERDIFEDQLLGTLCSALFIRIASAERFASQTEQELARRPLSSGVRFGLRWTPRRDLLVHEAELLTVLQRDADHLGAGDLDRVRRALRDALRALQIAQPQADHRALLDQALDYRRWHRFHLFVHRPGAAATELTRQRHAQLSGGEKAAALYAPLFAAAQATFSGGHPTAPHLIALDEAFEGIDAQGRPELLAITVAFDLDLLLTGYDLWLTDASIPAAMHAHLQHDPQQKLAIADLLRWDGRVLEEVVAPVGEL
jgi:hypothetical protein